MDGVAERADGLDTEQGSALACGATAIGPTSEKATAAAKVTDASRRKAGMTHLSGQRVEWIGANPGSAIACDNSCYRV
ncbi:hypothetical protein OKHIL_31650 [Mycolicibacterium mageritense]